MVGLSYKDNFSGRRERIKYYRKKQTVCGAAS